MPAVVDAESVARINQVFKWILAGHTEIDIQTEIQTQWPGTDPKRLIAAAVVLIRESGNVDPETVRGWCFEATRELYARMVAIGNYPGALRAVRQLLDVFAKK